MVTNREASCELTLSLNETLNYAFTLGQKLPARAMLTFSGELGAGKTTFIRSLVEGATQLSPREVSSPTFTYLHIYQGKNTIYHFDLYRLKTADDFFAAGFSDYLEVDGICCIEWAEKIIPHLQKLALPYWIHIDIAHTPSKEKRILTLYEKTPL